MQAAQTLTCQYISVSLTRQGTGVSCVDAVRAGEEVKPLSYIANENRRSRV